jgi:hypothetical protein
MDKATLDALPPGYYHALHHTGEWQMLRKSPRDHGRDWRGWDTVPTTAEIIAKHYRAIEPVAGPEQAA